VLTGYSPLEQSNGYLQTLSGWLINSTAGSRLKQDPVMQQFREEPKKNLI
jgi:hypothetical protein